MGKEASNQTRGICKSCLQHLRARGTVKDARKDFYGLFTQHEAHPSCLLTIGLYEYDRARGRNRAIRTFKRSPASQTGRRLCITAKREAGELG